MSKTKNPMRLSIIVTSAAAGLNAVVGFATGGALQLFSAVILVGCAVMSWRYGRSLAKRREVDQ